MAQSTFTISCSRNRQKRDGRRREGQVAGRQPDYCHVRQITLCTQFEHVPVQTYCCFSKACRIEGVALRTSGEPECARRIAVGIDDQQADTAGLAALAMRIDVKPSLSWYA